MYAKPGWTNNRWNRRIYRPSRNFQKKTIECLFFFTSELFLNCHSSSLDCYSPKYSLYSYRPSSSSCREQRIFKGIVQDDSISPGLSLATKGVSKDWNSSIFQKKRVDFKFWPLMSINCLYKLTIEFRIKSQQAKLKCRTKFPEGLLHRCQGC